MNSYCPGCQDITEHLVLERSREHVRRVQCKTCGGTHVYRAIEDVAWEKSDGELCRSKNGRILLERTADNRWRITIDEIDLDQKPIEGLKRAKQFSASALVDFDRDRATCVPEGYRARLLGESSSRCPYSVHVMRELWLDGWRAGAADAEVIERLKRCIVEAGLDTLGELLRYVDVEPDDFEPVGIYSSIERALRVALGLPDMNGET